MSKQLILGVSCANDFASDTPSVMEIQIGAELSDRIKVLAAAVKNLGVEAVEEFNYDGTWSSACLDASGAPDTDELSAMLETIDAESKSVEIPMIHIKAHSFYFTSVPKYGDDSMSLSTRPVEVSALDDVAPLLAL